MSLKITTYTIVAGDTLYGIAQKLYGNPMLYKSLAEYNGLDTLAFIHPGQVLKLPLPVFDDTKMVVPVVPTQERLDAIANVFSPGFCDGRMEYEIYAAAIGAENQYDNVIGRSL